MKRAMVQTISRRLILTALAALIAAPFAIARSPGVAPAAPKRHAVSIKDSKFNPDSLEIKAGDTVVWTNNEDRDHTVDGGSTFKSDNIKPGKSFSFKFDKAGKFTYTCTYHPREKGTITVAAADAKPQTR